MMSENSMTLINLLSDQIYANLIAFLSVRPKRVVWIYSDIPKYKQMLEGLKQFFMSHESQCTHEFILTEPYDPPATEAACLKTLGRGENVINVTGGTKIMALGAAAASQKTGAEIIYVDTVHQRVFNPMTGSIASFPYIAPTLQMFLKAQGWTVQGHSDPSEKEEKIWKRIWTYYIEKTESNPDLSWQKTIQYLHRGTFDESGTVRLQYGTLEQKTSEYRYFLDFLKMLNNEHIASVRESGNDITVQFSSPDLLPELKQAGNLLERRVLTCLSEHMTDYDGIMGSVKLKKEDRNTLDFMEQEVDALIAYRGRLGIISCKLPADKKKRQMYLQELCAVGDTLGGKMAALILITLEPIDPLIDSLFLHKAESMGITVLDKKAVMKKDFGEVLFNIMETI